MCCYNLDSSCTSLMVSLILYRTGSLFSAPYQFFICNHLSLGDKCHPNTGYWVFTCPYGIPLTFPGHWPTWGKRLGSIYSYLKKTKKLVLLLSDRVLFLWTIGLLWNLKKYFTYTGAFWAYPACITIIPQVFFPPSISSSFTGGHNWPYTQWHEWVPVTPDYQLAWWVWALSTTHT